MFKFFHLICGTSILGIIIANFFYIARSLQKADAALISYSIKTSYFGDAAIFLCLIIQLITANALVSSANLSIHVPWIFVAYHAFGVVVLLWYINFLLKFFYLSKLNILQNSQQSRLLKGNGYSRIFYLLNILIIIIYIIIIHDAVTQNTWFNFLFRK